MAKKYNVLSLCDGISTGMVALKAAGHRVGYYFSSEIDKFALQASKANFPGIFQLGNVYDVDLDRIPFRIDIVFMGFPCQGFSFAGKQLNFNDPRSQLFFKGCKILQKCRERNPNVKFLFENVRMRADAEKIITTMLGVKPIRIDSASVCAQTRKRLYWTNIEGVEQPEDREIYLQDILEDDVDSKYNLSDTVLARINMDEVRKKLYALKLEREKSRAILSSVGRTTHREYFEKNQGQLVEVVARINKSQDGKVFAVTGKSQCMSAGHNNVPKVALQQIGAAYGKAQDGRVYAETGKSPTLGTCIVPSVACGGAIRGRYMEDGSIEQQVELNSRSKSIALTTAEKDNIVAHIALGVVNSKGNMRPLKDKALNIDANYYKGLDNHAQRTHVASLVTDDADIVVHNLQPRQGKGQGGKGHIMRYPGNKPYCLDTACGQAIEKDLIIRRLTPTECHRLQGMPDGYLSMLSDSQQYKALGNGWQKDTIQHILSYLPKE